MIEHSVTVRGRHAAVCPRELVQHGVNSDTLSLDLDGEWEGMSVSLVLASPGLDPVELAWAGEPLAVPWELMEEPRVIWPVVVGREVAADGTLERQVVSARARGPLVVVPSGDVAGGGALPNPSVPTPGAGVVAVPSVSQDGTVSWSWGSTSDALPAPTDISGTRWLTGKGAPAIGGRVGDLYLDSATGRYYQYGEQE